jgi:hypothetical protein
MEVSHRDRVIEEGEVSLHLVCSDGDVEVACPPTTLALETPWGASSSGASDGDGDVTFPVDTRDASRRVTWGSDRGWRLAADGGDVPWQPTPPKIDYALPMMLADVVVIASAYPAIEWASNQRGLDTVVPLAYGLAYLATGAIVHARYDNDRQTAMSVARRLGYPFAFGLAGGLVGAAASADCSGDLCGLAVLVFAGAGVVVGAAVAVIEDWVRAHAPAW